MELQHIKHTYIHAYIHRHISRLNIILTHSSKNSINTLSSCRICQRNTRILLIIRSLEGQGAYLGQIQRLPRHVNPRGPRDGVQQRQSHVRPAQLSDHGGVYTYSTYIKKKYIQIKMCIMLCLWVAHSVGMDTYICTYVRMYVCMHVCMYVCTVSMHVLRH